MKYLKLVYFWARKTLSSIPIGSPQASNENIAESSFFPDENFLLKTLITK